MNFAEAVGESINRAACVILGNYVASEELLRYIVEPFSTGNDYNSARFLYNQRCNMAPPTAPPPPFTGGQCAGVSYRVDAEFEYNSNAIANPSGYTTLNGFAIVPGKVTGTRIDSTPGSVKLYVTHEAGEALIGGVNGSTNPGELVARNDRILSVVRQDGLPDTCGNPDPIIPPYQPGDNVYVDAPTYINNEGDTINIPLSITFGYADIDFNGNLSFPVDLDFELNPELNVNGEFNFNFGGFNPTSGNPRGTGGVPGLPPGGYGTDKEPTDPTLPSDEAPPVPLPGEDPPEREEVIAGCYVIVEQLDGKETVVFQGDNPDIILPTAGYVQFLIRAGDLSGWTEPQPVKSSRTFIPCPWEGGAYKVEGTGYYGAALNIIPLYVQRTLQPQFPD